MAKKPTAKKSVNVNSQIEILTEGIITLQKVFALEEQVKQFTCSHPEINIRMDRDNGQTSHATCAYCGKDIDNRNPYLGNKRCRIAKKLAALLCGKYEVKNG